MSGKEHSEPSLLNNQKKMKIGLVCPASLPATQFGGILFLCVDIARESTKIGHDVTIFTTDLDFANNANTFNKNLPRLELYDGFKINRTHVWLSFKLFFVNPGMYFQLRDNRPDIIHTIGIRSFQSLIAAIISKKYKIPLIISDQGGLTTHPDLQNSGIIGKIIYKLQEPFLKFIINQSTKISIPNDYEKKIFSKFTLSSKIRIIRNGINLEQFSSVIDFKSKYKIDGDFVLFVGRFAKVKGVDILLKAWHNIKFENSNENTKLVIMGVDFGFESEMLKIIKDLKLSDSVLVIKKPPREDILAAYSSCLFLALPSRWELSPLTPLEGFAFKKTTVSTTAHGIPYTITHGQNAILVDPEDYKQLSLEIMDMINNKEKRDRLGDAGYRLVQETCNSKVMTENTLRMYEEVLGDS